MDVGILKKVTREFNRYRTPECRARVILNRDGTLVVEFTGTKAAFACCFDENFIDYRYYLQDIAGIYFDITEIERKSPERFVVAYKRR